MNMNRDIGALVLENEVQLFTKTENMEDRDE